MHMRQRHIGFRSWYVQLRRCVRVSQKRAAFTFKGTRPFFMELVLSKIRATGPFATSGTTTHRRRWHPRRQEPRVFKEVHCLRYIYTHMFLKLTIPMSRALMLTDVSLFLFLSWWQRLESIKEHTICRQLSKDPSAWQQISWRRGHSRNVHEIWFRKLTIWAVAS